MKNIKTNQLIRIFVLIIFLIIFFIFLFSNLKNKKYNNLAIDDVPVMTFTDDNTGEDVIIKTDKASYSAESNVLVYFSIENKNQASQNSHVQFYFPKNIQVGLLNLQHKSKTGWENVVISDKVFAQPDLYKKNKVIPKNLEVKNSFDFYLPAGEVHNFRVVLSFSKEAMGEFWIESIGDKGAYGLLDPVFHVQIRAGTPSAGFSYSRSITVNSSQVPSTQTNFPMLISGTYTYLKTVGNGGDVQNSNGYDIGFYSNSNCSTGKLDWETETYTASSGLVNYWVRVPSIADGTVIYLCYGNSNISTDQSNKTGVWDSNYKGVWHLGNGTTLSATDSTSNGGNGTIATPTATTGKIDGGANFNGTSDIITVTGKMGSPTTMTLQAWVNKNSGTDGVKGGVVNVAGGVYMRADWNFGSGFRSGYYGAGQGNDIFTGSSISGTGWHLVSLVINPGSSSQILYNDGVSLGTSSNNYSIDYSQASDTIIGSAAGVYFAGIIDEVRVSNSARSADWITTEYNNQSVPGSFYTIGAQTGVSVSGSYVKVRGGNASGLVKFR